MNFPFFISNRIDKAVSNGFSSTIQKIAIFSVAFSLAVMIVSFLILGGFQKTIKEKSYSFSGHLQITKYDLNSSFDEQPISTNSDFYQTYEKFDFIDRVQEYSHKACMIKTEDEVEGVVLKGISKSFDEAGFHDNMVAGKFLSIPDSSYSKEIVVSKKLADRLSLKLGDEVIVYFIQKPVRFRKLNIVGIYDTGMEEFDSKFIFGDLGLIQRLNNWEKHQAGGFQVFVKDESEIDKAEAILYEGIDYDLAVEKASDLYQQIFEWLELISKNVYPFLVLILFVACINMISITLILIMERTQMIGILEALGATGRQIRRIFIYKGMRLILKGMLIGNILGIGYGLLQYYFKIVPLDPANYYMDYVPIDWNIWIIIGLNLLCFLIVSLILIIPTILITRINPIQAIRFD